MGAEFKKRLESLHEDKIVPSFFLTFSLSQRERGWQSGSPCLPLPRGEGWGEGNGSTMLGWS